MTLTTQGTVTLLMKEGNKCKVGGVHHEELVFVLGGIEEPII